MLMITGNAQYAEMAEQTLYNSVLSAVSLDGKRYFYTNPLRVSSDLPFTLRWSKDREEYIKLCNCCPPNVVRTVAEIPNYLYTVSDGTLWFQLYGASKLTTVLPDGSGLSLTQVTDYPWDGNVDIEIGSAPKKAVTLKLRIPSWAVDSRIFINDRLFDGTVLPGSYAEVTGKWKKGDRIRLEMPMRTRLIASNPLVEETRNELAVQRGPVVYCLESPDLPDGIRVRDISIPTDIDLKPERKVIDHAEMTALSGKALIIDKAKDEEMPLYHEISAEKPDSIMIRLIPYFAWDNRGRSEMSVWMPASW